MITTAPVPADAGSPATAPPSGAPGLVAWYAEGFSDILGDRLKLFDNAGPALELLRFAEPVATVPGFEAAVRARIEALAGFSHPACARVRALTLLDDPRPQLALVSELVHGQRLSAVLRAAHAVSVAPDAGSAVWMLRELLPALVALHEAGDGIAHGLIVPDRVVVTPEGTLVLTEYVLGGALTGLGLAPPGSDLAQMALLALAVMLGRPLRSDESTTQLPQALDEAFGGSAASQRLRPWLERALTPGDGGFASAREALAALDGTLLALPAAWSPALLPAGPVPSGTAIAPASPALPAPLSVTAFGTPAPQGVDGGGRWRINRLLAALAALEAVCIVVLLAQGATTRTPAPAPVTPPRPAVQAAGFLPVPARVAAPDPAAMAAAESRVSTVAPAPVAAAGSVIGWLVVEAEAEVKVYVNGRLLGVATRRRFGVPAGDHLITLASETGAFRSSQTVRIVAGKSVLITAKPE